MLQIISNPKSITGSTRQGKNNVPGYFDGARLKIITKATLFIAIAALIIAVILQIILPVKPYQPQIFSTGYNPGANNLRVADSETKIEMTHSIRNGLFKPSRRVNTGSITDKTVERIFSSLKLQGIMSIRGQKVAYIVLKNGQMRKCKIGEIVKDMFTVTDIQKNSVSIDILGHKLSLSR